MCKEPTEEQIKHLVLNSTHSYYTAREYLRELSYGGKPPNGYRSWGDYWKSY